MRKFWYRMHGMKKCQFTNYSGETFAMIVVQILQEILYNMEKTMH